jgi:hypothetical protein
MLAIGLWRTTAAGSVLLETLAPPEAIFAQPARSMIVMASKNTSSTAGGLAS